jgi:hypothetical protein
VAVLLVMGWSSVARSQEPPLDVPRSGRLTKPTDVLAVGGWLLYPSARAFGLWSDNLFQSPTSPIKTTGLGVAPGIIAEKSNGIHTTTLYANLEGRVYPDNSFINAFDRAAGFTQRYEALRDLNFTVQGDYAHRTIAGGLINGIPSPVTTPTTSVLPNGNTILPNGNIVDPAGNVVGQTNPGLSVVAANNLLVNPNDQFTATASVTKLLNRGILSVSGSISKTTYETPGTTPDYQVKSLRGNGGVWLGPLLYAYANVAWAWTDFSPTTSAAIVTPTLIGTGVDPPTASQGSKTSAYRAVGGLGTSRIGLMRASVYAGHQGSETQSNTQTSSAGGDVYGGRISYEPTRYWSFNASVEHIINIANGGAGSIIAQTIVTPTPIVVSTGSSTKTTASFLEMNYAISKLWSAFARFGYTRVEYLDSTRLDNAWLADFVLRYEMMRNLTLAWEYQYTSLVSNAPQISSQRNFFITSATYKF